ncbi:MAG: TIM-barrel domain-containing protein [Chitinophagaceae bacterium]
MKHYKSTLSLSLFLAFLLCVCATAPAIAQLPKSKVATTLDDTLHIINVQKVSGTTIALLLSNQKTIVVDFYGDNIFRLNYDRSGAGLRDPEAVPAANILVEQPRKPVSKLDLAISGNKINISTGAITIEWDKLSTLFKIGNNNKKTVVETLAPIGFDKKGVTLKLKEGAQEYFYGGGVQNGRFSHKGKTIAIENQNSWTDGGVASPTPFYWSTSGYGFMWYSFKKGKYDFGNKEKGVVALSHETDYLDVFFMIDEKPAALLSDFYQLTGKPLLLPKFGFYEGHLNAYNRDYWKADTTGILFEDGNRYKESQKENGGIKESLNGEKGNYPFSARGVIDRYKAHDMPLGWILPNDGYGAGYGQTGTLDSNMLNLKSFGDYARQHGVQIGLWTQSDLHPRDSISALLQRDIVKEVGVAGVRVLKTDVAWVGRGYSFGLNGVADAAQIMRREGNGARPFIISLDGWAGTQRYATVWSGDQTGGAWEYIRFHIPTYLGSGLSGQPNITSDMDGIFGGKNVAVNARDFQWKTFTPMQLNMDGWGSNEKYPHALGEPTASINRTYLKLKSALIPYTYSIAREAIDGLPMIRALFLEYPNSYTLGKATQYEYLFGPSFLVAPVYKETAADAQGNDIRNGIYLPKGTWIDYLSGDPYEGGRIINNFKAPIWKLPVFVKSGAIIPMTRPNNNVTEIDKGLRIYEVYPAGKSSFTEYDDDGLTEAYKDGSGATTLIESSVAKNTAFITVHPAKGAFHGFVKNKITEFRINVTQPPSAISVAVGKKAILLKKVFSKEIFDRGTNVYFYDAAPNLNQFATKGSSFEKVIINKNPQLLVRVATTDVTANKVILTVQGFRFAPADASRKLTGPLLKPVLPQVLDSNAQAYSLKPTWKTGNNVDYYEIDFMGQRYSTIKDTSLLFEDLSPETNYTFQLRSVNKTGTSPWTSFSATTKMNPLEFAIKGITAVATTPEQDGNEIGSLFDFDETNIWHTKYGAKAVPFEVVMDLKSINQIEKIQYLPRNRGNGILLKGTIAYSTDKLTWTEAGAFNWARTGDTKEFSFPNHPTVRYIKIKVTEAVGEYGSGRELYVFKVPGSESFVPGDINNDHRIDNNDFTSYANYTGLRKGDSDFEGYVSKGDVNKNGLIDAFDISNASTQLDGGVEAGTKDSVAGRLEMSSDKKEYKKDEIVLITVKGINLKSVNAMSFALPYNAQDLEYIGTTTVGTKTLENLTYDRLHTNGQKALYPTFVNKGNGQLLEGTSNLFILKLKAKRNITFDLKPIDGILVDKQLNVVTF